MTTDEQITSIRNGQYPCGCQAVGAVAFLLAELDAAHEQLQKYEDAARYPGDDQRHRGASVASQLVHAQHMREKAEAELDAARAREQQLVAELECAGHDIDDLLAREAKLRAVLRQCKCIGVRDYATCDQRREPVSRMCPRCAALAEGGTRRKAIEALAAEAQALGLYDAEGEDTHEAQ